MAFQPYIIRVASEKGGVGKTTVAVNLGLSLLRMGYRVLLVDGDTTNMSLTIHLGMEGSEFGYSEFVLEKMPLDRISKMNVKTGLMVLPGKISSESFVINESMLKRNIERYRSSPYDFVIIDSQPGVALPVLSQKHIDEIIVVNNPDYPSMISSFHLTEYLEHKGMRYSILMNKVADKFYEVGASEIREVYPDTVIGSLAYDTVVPKSIDRRIPAVMFNSGARFSRDIVKIAQTIESHKNPTRQRYKTSLWDSFMGVFNR